MTYPGAATYPSSSLYPGGSPAPITYPPIGTLGSPRWAWATGAWQALPTGELPNATARSLKLRLTGTSDASFTLDGTTPDAAAIHELVTDVWAVRNGFTLFRGRVGPTSDSVDGAKHTVQFSAGDYRAVLERRLLFDADTLTYTSTDAAAVAAGLIGSTQAHSGGGLNITDSSTPIGVSRTITYPAGQSIGQAIEQLSLMDDGWNWDIVPTTGQVGQAFTTWPSRGQNGQRVLAYPGQIASFTRGVDPGTYANAIRETGNTGLAAAIVAASDITTRPEGRWDVQLGDTSLLDVASVTARANYDLASRQQVVPTWAVKLAPGSWGGPTDIWLGDVVLLAVRSGRLEEDGTPLRVFEIDIDLDDADQETVTLTLAALDPFKRSRARQYDFRLTRLERR